MSQGHRRHGGGSYTLLYYIGLEGKEDRRTEEQKTEGQKNRKKRKGNGRQKDRRTEKKDKQDGRQKDKRTEKRKERKTKGRKKNKNRWKGEQEKGARGPEKARKLSPAALEQPYRALGAMLQLSCSIVTGLLEKVYGGGWEIMPEHMERCRLGNAVAESAHIIKISAT